MRKIGIDFPCRGGFRLRPRPATLRPPRRTRLDLHCTRPCWLRCLFDWATSPRSGPESLAGSKTWPRSGVKAASCPRAIWGKGSRRHARAFALDGRTMHFFLRRAFSRFSPLPRSLRCCRYRPSRIPNPAGGARYQDGGAAGADRRRSWLYEKSDLVHDDEWKFGRLSQRGALCGAQEWRAAGPGSRCGCAWMSAR